VNLTKNIYLSFASATKVCVLCYLLAEYVTVTSS